jgi:hypothetical protein
MTDIVDRLKLAAGADSFHNAKNLKLDAAAEIEKLRAELGHCATLLETASRQMGNGPEMAMLATQRYRDAINGRDGQQPKTD